MGKMNLFDETSISQHFAYEISFLTTVGTGKIC